MGVHLLLILFEWQGLLTQLLQQLLLLLVPGKLIRKRQNMFTKMPFDDVCF